MKVIEEGDIYPSHRYRRYITILTVSAMVLFGLIIIRRAWLSDDSYITFRTIDNFIHGYRLTWNTTERVQSYTHPLWMLFLSLIYSVTHEVYLTALITSLVISFSTIVIFARKVSGSIEGALLGILILMFSNAYVDYSTSGLENPLTHLILVAFFWLFLTQKPGVKTLFFLSLIASFGLLNRMDTALIYAPPLIYSFFQIQGKREWLKGIFSGMIGQLPFILWELFSIFYYGFPFPNTAYSKITTAISSGDLFRRGLYYGLNSLQHDPLTLIVIVSAVILSVCIKDKRNISISAGIVLYILYIIKIGGDFMGGRFFAAPLLCAVVILSQSGFQRLRSKYISFACASVMIIGILAPIPSFLLITPYAGSYRDSRDIADERRAFYPSTGLLRNNLFNTDISNHWADEGKKMRTENPYGVIGLTNIGFFGFFAGPNVHIIDYYGLSDPLIARIPPKSLGGYWRAGHLERIIPQGYLFTVESAGQRIYLSDEYLAEYYQKLVLITRGPLFDRQRFIEIWKMNTGQYDHLVDYYFYRYPRMVNIKLSEMDDQPVIFTEHGIRIHLPDRSNAGGFNFSLRGNQVYELIYQDNIEIIGKEYLRVDGDGIIQVANEVKIPEKVAQYGFNRITIVPVDQIESEFTLTGFQLAAKD